MFFSRQKSKKRSDENSPLQNPHILEVNLVKGEPGELFVWKKNLLTLGLILFIAAVLVVQLYLGLNWWEKNEDKNSQAIASQVAATTKEATKLKRQVDDALAYKDKSIVVSGLLKEHIYWTNFFSWLEKNTISNVKYQGFSGGIDGQYTLEATAKTYADASWQVKAFLNDPIVQSASVDSVSYSSGQEGDSSVHFSIKLVVKPKIFKK